MYFVWKSLGIMHFLHPSFRCNAPDIESLFFLNNTNFKKSVYIIVHYRMGLNQIGACLRYDLIETKMSHRKYCLMDFLFIIYSNRSTIYRLDSVE